MVEEDNVIIQVKGDSQYIRREGNIEETAQKLKAIPEELFKICQDRLGSFFLIGTDKSGDNIGAMVSMDPDNENIIRIYECMLGAANTSFMEVGKRLGYTWDEVKPS